MIVYDLRCPRGHTFEGWFANAHECQRQMEEGLVPCPVCGEGDVERLISPTRSIKSRKSLQQRRKTALDVLEGLTSYVEENFEDVGPDFTKEALKMHADLIEKRNIRGTTTEEEEKLLKEEGVSLLKVPILKKKLDS